MNSRSNRPFCDSQGEDHEQPQRPHYIYESLRSASSIRLLAIEADPHCDAETDDPSPIYSLIYTTTERAPPYDTLSYVWGTSNRSRILELKDGTFLYITKTLDKALPYIARHCETRYIWVDQICIHQDNLQERSQQVSIMGDIYRNCQCVLVWLGATKTLDPDFESVCLESNRLDDATEFNETTIQPLQHRLEMISRSPTSRRAFLQDLASLVEAAWFTRAWVFQEIVLPGYSKFILGESHTYRRGNTLSLIGLQTIVIGYLELFPPHILAEWNSHLTHSVACARLQLMAEEYAKRHGISLLEKRPFEEILSLAVSRAKTSNVLDQLYAYFPLLEDPSIKLQPTYGIRKDKALISTAQSIIRGTQRLNIFEYVPRKIYPQDILQRKILPDVPSWVPDFFQDAAVLPFYRGSNREGSPAITTNSRLWLGSCTPRLLTAYGKRIDAFEAEITSDRRHTVNSDEDLKSMHDSATNAWAGISNCSSRLWLTMERILLAFLAEGYGAYFRYGRKSIRILADSIVPYAQNAKGPENTIDEQRLKVIREDLMACKDKLMACRSLWLTRAARFAIGSRIDRGDIICILHGCTHPVALQEVDRGMFIVLGTCYLEGWMDPWNHGKINWAVDDVEKFILV